jgi:hypothetical protein
MNFVPLFGSQLLPPTKHTIWFSPLAEAQQDPFNEEALAYEEAVYEESRQLQGQGPTNIGMFVDVNSPL